VRVEELGVAVGVEGEQVTVGRPLELPLDSDRIVEANGACFSPDGARRSASRNREVPDVEPLNQVQRLQQVPLKSGDGRRRAGSDHCLVELSLAGVEISEDRHQLLAGLLGVLASPLSLLSCRLRANTGRMLLDSRSPFQPRSSLSVFLSLLCPNPQ